MGYIPLSATVEAFDGRVGFVTPQSGDYTAAEVTNAADKASSSLQQFSGPIALGLGAASSALEFPTNSAGTADIVAGSDGNLYLEAPGGAGFVFRPRGIGVSTDQATIDQNGFINGAGLVASQLVSAIGGLISGNGSTLGPALWAGSGAASGALGANGDYYLRSDGTAQNRLYQKITGSWVTATDVVLDATAGDVQPIGAQAAGSTGKVSDAGHVHAISQLGFTLGVDATLSTTTFTTVGSTITLPAGPATTIWLLLASVTVANGNSTAGTVELQVSSASGTQTFLGASSAQAELPAAAGQTTQVRISTIMTVSGAGTNQINIQVKAPGSVASTAKAATPTSTVAGASGAVLIKIG